MVSHEVFAWVVTGTFLAGFVIGVILVFIVFDVKMPISTTLNIRRKFQKKM